jgi:glyoxylase-like metal-dependent hydrolase (beta-lactamase superfamily II)
LSRYALRRRAAAFVLVALAGGVAGCAGMMAPPAARPVPLAAGVYMVPGSGGAADEHNLGRIGNAGFIVGPDGVVAVDSGTSHAHGQALLAAIASVTDRPLRVLLLTHVRPEFVFGATAFRERGVPVHMQSRGATLMAARCETCLKNLRQVLGDVPLRGTALVKPDRTFDASHELTLIGRPVRVLHFGHGSGPGDIAVLDVQSGVVFAGGLLDAGRVPDIQDSDLAGWRRALGGLRALDTRTVVPGHGPAVESARAIAGVQDYLDQLERKVRALLDSGTSLLDVAESAELPGYETWDQYDVIHRRNASIAFLRFEREAITKPEAPK